MNKMVEQYWLCVFLLDQKVLIRSFLFRLISKQELRTTACPFSSAWQLLFYNWRRIYWEWLHVSEVYWGKFSKTGLLISTLASVISVYSTFNTACHPVPQNVCTNVPIMKIQEKQTTATGGHFWLDCVHIQCKILTCLVWCFASSPSHM